MSDTPKCPNVYCNLPEGHEDIECRMAPPAPAGLDFTAARAYADIAFGWEDDFREHLQAQHRHLLAAAVQQARREAGDESLLRMIAGLDDEVQRLQRRTTEIHQYYAPLVAAVREWQEASEAHSAMAGSEDFEAEDKGAAYTRLLAAEDALAALQLPEAP